MEIPEKIYILLKNEVEQFFTNILIEENQILTIPFQYIDSIVTALKVKIIQIYEKKCDYFDFDIIEISNDKLKTLPNPIFHDIIYFSLFLQKTNCFIQILLRYLRNDHEILETSELKILEIILDYGLLVMKNKTQIETAFRSCDIENKLVQTIKNDDKESYIKILTDIVPKYCSFTQNNILELLYNKTDQNFVLDVICILEKDFFCVDHKRFNLLYENSFWELLKENLCSSNKKLALFLLKRAITLFVINKNSVLPKINEIDLLSVGSDFENHDTAWKNFFIMFETTREKQIHLILPILNLYGSVEPLNEAWKVCLLKQFLFHSQNAIVKKAVVNILSHKWLCPLDLLLIGLNNSFLYESEQIKELLNDFFIDLDKKGFSDFVSEMGKLNLQPIPMYFLLKNINLMRISSFRSDFCISLFEIVSKNKIERVKNFLYVTVTDFVNTLFEKSIVANDFSLDELQKVVNFVSINLPKNLRPYFLKNLSEKKFDKYKDLSMSLIFHKSNPLYFDGVLKDLDGSLFSGDQLDKKNCFQIVSDVDSFESEIFSEKFLDHLKFLIENDKIVSLCQSVVIPIFKRLTEEKNFITLIKLFETLTERDKCFVNYLFENEKSFNAIIVAIDSSVFVDRLEFSPLKIFMLANNPSVSPETFFKTFNTFFDINGTDYLLFTNCILANYCSKVTKNCFDENLILILRKIQNELFYRGVSSFLNSQYFILVSYQLKNVYLKENLEVFCCKIFENNHTYTDYSILRLNFLRQLVRCFDYDKNIILDWKGVVMRSLLNCPLFTRDQRIEFDICTEIDNIFYEKRKLLEFPILNSENYSRSDSQVRLLAIYITLQIAQNFTYEQCLKYIIEELEAKYNEIAGKRYYENSQNHFTKLRITQFFNIIFDYIDRNELKKFSDWLFQNLTNEPHQPKVKILIQWLYSRTLIKLNENFGEVCKNLLLKAKSLQGISVGTLFPIFYNILKQCEGMSYDVMKFLTNYSMGPNFKVRYGAQVAIKFIYENIPYVNANESYKLVYETATAAISNTSSDNVQDKFDLAYLELCDASKFDNIYYHLPRLTGVEKYQYFTEKIDTFEPFINPTILEKYRSSNQNLNHLEYNEKKIVYEDDFIENFENVQKKYENISNENKTVDSNLILVGSLIDKVPNLGGLSRTCEIFGVKKYILNNVSIIKNKEYQNLSMSSENWVVTEQVKMEDLPNFLKKMKENGYQIVGAEQTSDSQKLGNFKFEKNTVLILGNEKEGIPPNLIHLLDVCLEIPQFGQLRSLNVHVAGALLIWEYTKQITGAS